MSRTGLKPEDVKFLNIDEDNGRIQVEVDSLNVTPGSTEDDIRADIEDIASTRFQELGMTDIEPTHLERGTPVVSKDDIRKILRAFALSHPKGISLFDKDMGGHGVVPGEVMINDIIPDVIWDMEQMYTGKPVMLSPTIVRIALHHIDDMIQAFVIKQMLRRTFEVLPDGPDGS